MDSSASGGQTPNRSGQSRFWWILTGVLAVLVLVLSLRSRTPPTGSDAVSTGDSAKAVPNSRSVAPARPFSRVTTIPARAADAGPPPEQIVHDKLVQFVRDRRKLMHDMADRLKVKVPARLDEYFNTVEAGKWEDIEAAFKSLSDYKKAVIEKADQNDRPGDDPDPEAWALAHLWRSVTELDGVVRTAHNWPAQRLLDYGNAILDSLRPGTVYLGGTDPGRFIPTLLNETSEGEHHVVLAQTAFADGTYLEYMRAMYGDRIAVPTAEDSQRAFQDYMTDAQKRLKHDQDFPNEPKQIRPGEDIRISDNRIQVSGQVAVMAINERLANMFMEKNPGLPFAIEQGMPLDSVYARSTPLGPIMEIGSPDSSPDKLPAERAAQAVEYWRTAAQQLNADPTSNDSPYIRDAYAKMASEQGALLLKRDQPTQAEEAFRIATEIAPGQPDAVFRYVNVLTGQSRFNEAVRTMENAMKAAPDNQQFRDLADYLRKQIKK